MGREKDVSQGISEIFGRGMEMTRPTQRGAGAALLIHSPESEGRLLRRRSKDLKNSTIRKREKDHRKYTKA